MKKQVDYFTTTYLCPVNGISFIEGFTEKIYAENSINPVKTSVILKECSNWSSDCIGRCPKYI